MERIIVIIDGGVYEYIEAHSYHYLCKEEHFEKGPRLTQKRLMITRSQTPSVYSIFVKTNEHLWQEVGLVCFISGDHKLPKKMYVRGRESTTIPIEDGSPLHKALREYFFNNSLAKEICKAPDNSEESYW